MRCSRRGAWRSCSARGRRRRAVDDKTYGGLSVLPAEVGEVVDGVDACGYHGLDSSRVVVVVVAVYLLDMDSWLGEARTGEDDDGGRP